MEARMGENPAKGQGFSAADSPVPQGDALESAANGTSGRGKLEMVRKGAIRKKCAAASLARWQCVCAEIMLEH